MAEKKNRLGLSLSIDENNLLLEWKTQPALMLEYGIRLADALQEEDEARAAAAIVSAKLDKEIRDNPEDFGVAKITESAILAAVQTHPRNIEAQETLMAARCDARVYKAAVDALAHRKSALQGMTDLYLRQWFADPARHGQGDDAGAPRPSRAVGAEPPGPPPGRRVRRVAEDE